MLYRKYIKQLLDKCLAFILILIFSPVFIIVGLLIYLQMGTPVLFKQERPGLYEKLFTIYKFRTMTNDIDSHGVLLADERRLSHFGSLVRRLSMDELPQLVNVLKGEMSFVGPRPLLVEYLPLYDSEQKRRHEVRPGITGWAQINGRNAISWEEKFKYDVWYVEHQSFFLDIKIIWRTILKVVSKSDISSKTSVSMEKFEGSK